MLNNGRTIMEVADVDEEPPRLDIRGSSGVLT